MSAWKKDNGAGLNSSSVFPQWRSGFNQPFTSESLSLWHLRALRSPKGLMRVKISSRIRKTDEDHPIHFSHISHCVEKHNDF